MTLKETFLDFLYFIIILTIIGFSIFYFIVYKNVFTVIEIMKMLVPFGLFLLLFVFKMSSTRKKLRIHKRENTTDVILYLTYWDKVKGDIIVYGLPLIVLGLPLIFGGLDSMDIIQAGVVFVGCYFIQKLIFSKQH